MNVIIKAPHEIDAMRLACQATARVMNAILPILKPGMATIAIDRLVRSLLEEGADASFWGYYGFPAAVCVSINEEVAHGIPSHRVIRNGDVVSIDVGVRIDGWNGDMARTVIVGKPKLKDTRLVTKTEAALEAGIRAIKPGARLGDIGEAIQMVAQSFGLNVAQGLTGHGIGRKLHEQPPVPNVGVAGTGQLLIPGMVLALEPIFTHGSGEIQTRPDKWTLVTADQQRAAHFEDTIVVTNSGAEVLTWIVQD